MPNRCVYRNNIHVILNISPSFASVLHNVNMSPDREEYWITGYGRLICSWIIVHSLPMSSNPKYCTISVYIDVIESGRYLDSLWKYLAYCRFGLDPCVLVAERKGLMGLFVSEIIVSWRNWLVRTMEPSVHFFLSICGLTCSKNWYLYIYWKICDCSVSCIEDYSVINSSFAYTLRIKKHFNKLIFLFLCTRSYQYPKGFC